MAYAWLKYAVPVHSQAIKSDVKGNISVSCLTHLQQADSLLYQQSSLPQSQQTQHVKCLGQGIQLQTGVSVLAHQFLMSHCCLQLSLMSLITWVQS